MLARISKAAANQVRSHGVEPFDYAKTTFLGLSGPKSSSLHRAFAGEERTGEAYKSSIPRPSEVEAYFVPLPDGGHCLVAFRSFAPSKLFEKVRTEVTRSWKAAP